MKIKNYWIRWMARDTLSLINKVLMSVFGVKKAKVLITKYYQGRKINLENPEKLNEKLLSDYYNSDMDIMARLTDKYAVRDYIKEKGLEEILVPIYGVYKSFKEIDFDKLPKKFVLKATHGCDMNYICSNKSEFDAKDVKRRVNLWLHTSIAYMSLELHYVKIRPRIICEMYLENQSDIIDYKFHCYGGEVLFVLVCTERSGGDYRDVFMTDWTHRPDAIIHTKMNPNGVEKPEKYDLMLKIAKTLSEDHSFVRVDLYEVQGKVYFGELTFTPATGVLNHFTDEFLLEQGRRCE